MRIYLFYIALMKKCLRNHDRKISKALDQLKKFYETQSNTFNRLAFNGKLSDFKNHFSNYADYMAPDFYDLLITHLLKTNGDQNRLKS